MNNKNNKKVFITTIAFVILGAFFLIGLISSIVKNTTEGSESLDDLTKNLKYNKAVPVKASVDLSEASLYDELPDINKYPLAVEGKGQIDIEIFTSGEKAGNGTDSWLITCAEKFNKSNQKTSDGKTISISVRSVSSGLAADYIMSSKYLPDLYTPSNTLFGDYAISQGAKLEIYNERLVGNTAGILVKKGNEYKSANDVINAVISGNFNLGYTNPQTSATGLNLLIHLLSEYGEGNISSDKAKETFSKFNNNIPYVAYTTQQMRDSASNGSLDAMVTEYQAYINDDNLKSAYDFIPFGLRHDNPLYIVNKSGKSESELEAIDTINKYLTNSESQSLATQYGFNANDDYKSDLTAGGAIVSQALKIYKTNKDSGKDIIAVFVADCSGSMSGDAIAELKSSLSNGMKYINENNYVGLVSYSSDITIELDINKFDLTQKSYFQGALNNLSAGGGTSTYEAVCVGLKMIEEAKKDHPDSKCMLFVLSDGMANGDYSLNKIKGAVKDTSVPIYSIAYTKDADKKALSELSNINEAAVISADSEDIVYKIKQLFNAQL